MGEEKQTWRGNVRGQEMEVGEEDGGRGITVGRFPAPAVSATFSTAVEMSYKC